MAQLGATEAIQPLIDEVFWRADDVDEWVVVEMPHVFEHLGPLAIPALAEYLSPQHDHGIFPRLVAISCLKRLAFAYEMFDVAVLEVLRKQLEQYEQHHLLTNSFMILAVFELSPALDINSPMGMQLHKLIEKIVSSGYADIETLKLSDYINFHSANDDDDEDDDDNPYSWRLEDDSKRLSGVKPKSLSQHKKDKRKQATKSKKINRNKQKKRK